MKRFWFLWLVVLMACPAFGPPEFGYGRSDNGLGTVYLQAGIHFSQPINR